ARGAEGVREAELGHHHALEHVGRLPEDDGVDVLVTQPRVFQRAAGGLAQEAGQRHVVALGGVLGLSDPDDAAAGHACPSSTATRFCCRQGPLVAWATARRARPSRIRCAAAPRRVSPATMTGFEASAPPEGFTRASGPRPSASRKMISWWVKGA